MAEHDVDYDSPWKEVLERYFQEFMAFFFPEAHAQIAWAEGYEFLDTELQQVVRDAESGRRLADKLVSVSRHNGEEAWVLVHIEVQGSYEKSFAQRMYVYNYRIYDRYERKVASLAVLADDRPSWNPSQFSYELFGCKVSLEFPTVKLLDYASREPELEASPNPFAIVVLAYLKTRATARQPEERFDWKLRLFKLLYHKGFSREDILELTRFLDWIMVLPEDLEKRFEAAMVEYEEEERMKYVTSFERIATKRGLEKGMQQGMQQGMQKGELKRAREDVLDILMARFEQITTDIVEVINRLNNSAILKDLLKKAALADSLQTFEAEARAIPLPDESDEQTDEESLPE